MSFLFPKPPTPPKLPSEGSRVVKANKAALLGKFARKRQGGTIATSGLGIQEQAPVTKKTLGGVAT